jgi:hypothetical protein
MSFAVIYNCAYKAVSLLYALIFIKGTIALDGFLAYSAPSGLDREFLEIFFIVIKLSLSLHKNVKIRSPRTCVSQSLMPRAS